MNLKHFFTVFSFSYLDRIKSKAFVISTLILLLIGALVIFSPNFTNKFNEPKSEKVAVLIDDSTNLKIKKSALNEMFSDYSWSTGAIEDKKQFLKKVENKSLKSLFVVKNQDGRPAIDYYSLTENPSLVNSFTAYIQASHSYQVAEEEKLDQAVFSQLFAKVETKQHLLNDSKTSTTVLYILLISMYIAILTYGQAVATSIAAEKSNRVMEIVMTKVKPTTIMFGKIFGVGFASLTQFCLVIFGFLLMGKYFSKENSGISTYISLLEKISLEQILYFLVFFILGYFVYASLFAIIGAMVNKTEDLNGAATPISIVMVVCYVMSMRTLTAPDTVLAKIISFVPFSSPTGMFIRVSTSDIPVYEVALSIGILVATIILLAAWAAKVYPKNIMNYSSSSASSRVLFGKKKPVKREAVQWL